MRVLFVELSSCSTGSQVLCLETHKRTHNSRLALLTNCADHYSEITKPNESHARTEVPIEAQRLALYFPLVLLPLKIQLAPSAPGYQS